MLVFKYKKIEPKNPILPFIGLTFFASIYELFFTLLFKINSIYWFQIYPLLSFLAILYFFNQSVFKNIIVRVVIFLAFIAIYLISFFYIDESSFTSSSLNRFYISLFVFGAVFSWFKIKFDDLENIEMFRGKELVNLWDSASFYFVAGLLLYYSITFFLFIASNFIYESDLYFNDFWLINVLATLLFRILLIITAWKMKKA